ncbi:putative oxidoreductase [Paramyrothecium foliicola]|nr:putative oxidoreductase [Paramyrothecium foliicola]
MATTSALLGKRASLANGATIPQIQLGLYMMSGREAKQSVHWALGIGYRGFDCAQMYHNEREAGKAIADFLASPDNKEGLKREDIFYTTKLSSNGTNYSAVRRSIKNSVEVSGLGYVDLFLLHSPYGGKEARLTSWKALEDAVNEGEVKMAGVSNYGVAHIEELMASNPSVKPVINQIEVHPFNTQVSIRKVCAKYDIAIEAYAPLARGMRMKHPKILSLAKKYSCSPAQLFVKWSLQHDMITLPKSVRRDRLIENADVAGFEISAEDVAEMDGLDEGLVTDCLGFTMSDQNATTPRVFIARHGETEWTISGQCTGNAEVLLTENGVKQSRGTGQMLVGPGKLIEPSKLAHVFCSPRKRAVDTLDLLLGTEWKGTLESDQKISITSDITEWDYGAYEGLTPKEINARREAQGLGKWNIWAEGCEGGESPSEVQKRLDELIGRITEIQEPFMHGGPAPDVLVVAHGHILRAFVKRWLKYPMDFQFTMMMEPGAVGILSYAHHNVEEPAILKKVQIFNLMGPRTWADIVAACRYDIM